MFILIIIVLVNELLVMLFLNKHFQLIMHIMVILLHNNYQNFMYYQNQYIYYL